MRRCRPASLVAVVGCAALALPSAASALPEPPPLVQPLQQAAADAGDTVTQTTRGAIDAATGAVPTPAAAPVEQPAATTETPPAGAAAKPAVARDPDPAHVRAPHRRTTRASASGSTPT